VNSGRLDDEAEAELGGMGRPAVGETPALVVALYMGMPEDWAKPDEAVVGGSMAYPEDLGVAEDMGAEEEAAG
jgi:hypothetical protein